MKLAQGRKTDMYNPDIKLKKQEVDVNVDNDVYAICFQSILEFNSSLNSLGT